MATRWAEWFETATWAQFRSWMSWWSVTKDAEIDRLTTDLAMVNEQVISLQEDYIFIYIHYRYMIYVYTI